MLDRLDAAVGAEAVHVVGALDDLPCDITDRYPGRGHPSLRASMGVTVQDQVGARSIDGLPQKIASEERIDLQSLSTKRGLHRGVVQERHSVLGLEFRQRPPQPRGNVARMSDQGLHLRLAEVAPAGPGEPAAEPLRCSDRSSMWGRMVPARSGPKRRSPVAATRITRASPRLRTVSGTST